MRNQALEKLSKDELIRLIEIYSKNWLALDGVWFQTIEQKLGMDEAMFHDKEAWSRFTVIEAKRIKKFLNLPENPGLDGLQRALALRFYANINEDEYILDDKRLIYRNVDCRVQSARKRKGMEYHPCREVGIIEYSEFARTVDSRISCRCLSCYPDITDETCCCAWEFTLNE